MKVRRLFIDTGILVASVRPRDPDHAEAMGYLQRVVDHEWQSVHVSDYVVAEALNFLRMKEGSKEAAEKVITLVFGSERHAPLVSSMLKVHSGRFARAVERYRIEFDRGLSLTDWTTVVTMQEAKIGEIATFDQRLAGALGAV